MWEWEKVIEHRTSAERGKGEVRQCRKKKRTVAQKLYRRGRKLEWRRKKNVRVAYTRKPRDRKKKVKNDMLETLNWLGIKGHVCGTQ